MRLSKLGLISMASVVTFPAAALRAQTPQSGPRGHATEVLNEITMGDFGKVEAQYDSAMNAGLPPGRLAQAWTQLTSQVGPFKTITQTTSQQAQGVEVVTLVTVFERATLDMIIAFRPDGRIAGLRFVPHQEPAAWTLPAYAHPDAFHEQPISVSFRHWQLPGTLTIPNGSGPFPLVILVQGSGPHDQDETIGPNKPFKDLAWGLASHGVAVLRYPKRTAQYGAKASDDPQSLTVNDEVIDDARAAVDFAAKQPGIDPRRIYVLGHSLGGYLAPRIAHGDPQVAGLIIMAGSTRPLEQVVIDQMRYLASIGAIPADRAETQISAAEQDAKTIESPALAKSQTVELAGTKIPASYLLDLRDYHPAEVAAKSKIPILILQGARDYQVTQADYEGWKQALGGHSNVTFRLYPGFTHLFMVSSAVGTGLGTPADYDRPGHVDEQVIQDVASWLEAVSKTPGRNP